MTEHATPPEAAIAPPGPMLRIGVTGHRLERLGPKAVPDTHRAVARAIETIGAAAADLSPPPACRLITSLAEGADSIAADEALAAGWSIDAILPLARDDYAADFPDDAARAAHHLRLATAHAVFELPGQRNGDNGAEAYERAGRIVLGQCDILLAIWDRAPVRGRGGAAQIVAEAVIQGIPVIHIDPTSTGPATLLWDGLTEHDLGQQTVETVPSGQLDALPALIATLLAAPTDPTDIAMLARFERRPQKRYTTALAYPLLLALMGVRYLRRSDLRVTNPAAAERQILGSCGGIGQHANDFGERLRAILTPRFARADAAATHIAQVFRSGYVANFFLAALAVLLSLMGLALPYAAKPVLIALELLTISTILILTSTGNRVAWHRRWLDSRQLAERLRCLAMSAQVGELDLRVSGQGEPHWVGWYARATAREVGLPNACVDAAYLSCVRDGLCDLIDGQITYLSVDMQRMHRLEHRLHRTGGVLFIVTAAVCISFLLFQTGVYLGLDDILHGASKPLAIGVTILSAALPAFGAAIYGIRMQGDFAGVAERAETLAQQLVTLRKVVAEDDVTFDTLRRRIRRTADLLTADLATWRHTYRARPLALPG